MKRKLVFFTALFTLAASHQETEAATLADFNLSAESGYAKLIAAGAKMEFGVVDDTAAAAVTPSTRG